MTGCVIVALTWIGILIFAGYFYRAVVRDMRDKGFDPKLPHSTCAAKLGVGMGMPITCGRKTNRKTLGYWHCWQHNPEDAEDYKAKLARYEATGGVIQK